jgi:hypothetical protein
MGGSSAYGTSNNGNNETTEIELVKDHMCMVDRSHAWTIDDAATN